MKRDTAESLLRDMIADLDDPVRDQAEGAVRAAVCELDQTQITCEGPTPQLTEAMFMKGLDASIRAVLEDPELGEASNSDQLVAVVSASLFENLELSLSVGGREETFPPAALLACFRDWLIERGADGS